MTLTNLMAQQSAPDNTTHELRVTFYPELFLQRRVWILNFLRKEGITRVLDVGCGEGALLNTLCQPAPWLTPPPASVLPISLTSSLSCPPSPAVPTTFNSQQKAEHRKLPSPAYGYTDDDIPNLHICELHGIDISDEDLAFSVEATTPPESQEDAYSSSSSSPARIRSYSRGVQRWEELTAKVWKGGLEVPNDEFIDMECIVAMEVIEHLHPDVLAKFAPTLLGVYHPKYLLITTPSYTFNDRFLPPDAPMSSRTGYPDPTGRTERVFRHSDHKFEWTRGEFQAWCEDVAKEWGYEVNETSIGRAQEDDPWGRDDELQGATQVAAFYKIHTGMTDDKRSAKARTILSSLSTSPSQSHTLLSSFVHPANVAAKHPVPLADIAKLVKSTMEEFRLSFLRVEELWFEPDISELCGGWIEVLIRAVEESSELALKKDIDGVRKGRSMWSVELVDGLNSPYVSSGGEMVLRDDEETLEEAEEWRKRMSGGYDSLPDDWIPGESSYDASVTVVDEQSDPEDDTTGAEEGDVSAASDEEADSDTGYKGKRAWKNWSSSPKKKNGSKGGTVKADNSWYDQGAAQWDTEGGGGWGQVDHVPHSAISSTGGWDGDESNDETTS
ncbi:hypothetical protein CPB83DRAFT_844740 [Crepidotus variabilis]|uniref:Small RNA 2'-O-methyltransferase n=1 Tax=Crepidotus variabilis TaxID=179855 RepID=A0A9P6ES26_9AGAR|nr:hypothetical protein CPB83DRAFT_844740 [Crepidotus variabilis]